MGLSCNEHARKQRRATRREKHESLEEYERRMDCLWREIVERIRSGSKLEAAEATIKRQQELIDNLLNYATHDEDCMAHYDHVATCYCGLSDLIEPTEGKDNEC